MIRFIPRPLLRRLHILRALTSRAMTLGVKGVVQDEQGRVLLVRHTYVDGWHLPGGGVERNETLSETVIKELYEETLVTVSGKPRHFQTYRNPRTSRFDHVAVFICETWQQGENWAPDDEIADIGFFPLDKLPGGTTGSTRATLNEIFADQPVRDIW